MSVADEANRSSTAVHSTGVCSPLVTVSCMLGGATGVFARVICWLGRPELWPTGSP